MEKIKTKIEEVIILEPTIHSDARGWFYESWTADALKKLGKSIEFVQDNHAMSVKKGTLRGLHFQKAPFAQTKLVRCTRGEILDVAVDIRKGSPTYCQWVSVVLSDENKRQLLVPAGFAHGYVTLTDNAEVQYKVDAYYAPECDRGVRYDDPAFGIDWRVSEPILSDKDKKVPLLAELDNDFTWTGDGA